MKQPLEFIDYLLDCTLATVETMSMMSKPPKSEFRRPCAIAQKAIDYLGRDYNYRSRIWEHYLMRHGPMNIAGQF